MFHTRAAAEHASRIEAIAAELAEQAVSLSQRKTHQNLKMETLEMSTSRPTPASTPTPMHTSVLSNSYPTAPLESSNSNSNFPYQPTSCLNSSFSITSKVKFFPRKPRCLLLGDDRDPDLIITSSLDGSVQWLWGKELLNNCTLFLPTLVNRPCFAEDMCLVPCLNGALLTTVDAMLGGTAEDPGNSSSSVIFLPLAHKDSKAKPAVLSDQTHPHQKAISVIQNFEMASDSDVRFLTGGLDKSVSLWRIEDNLQVVSIQQVHRSHTSAVQALAQLNGSPGELWSGGADWYMGMHSWHLQCSRLLGWSHQASRTFFTHRFNHRISHLLTNKHHPRLLLTCFCSKNNQLQLVDSRGPITDNPRSFGHGELQYTSRYVRPSWAPDGNLLALGTTTPEDKVSAINVWDIRKISPHGHPMLSITFASERRFLACEFGHKSDSIVATATDGSLNFVDFSI